MSLIPTYVLAEDGVFYKNPCLHGVYEDKIWYICWDDDDPTELVISNIVDIPSANRLGKEILNSLGKKYSKLRLINCYKGYKRTFPPKFKGFKQAATFFFDFDECIPIPQKHQGVHPTDRTTDCVIYNFGHPLPSSIKK